MELGESEFELLKVEVGKVETLGEGLEAALAVPTVGVRSEEAETETVEEREPVLEVEGHAEEEGVAVPHLEGPTDLEADTVEVEVFVFEVDAVGEMETVLVFELVCVEEGVLETESELETEAL